MQEESTQKTIAIVVRSGKLTEHVLKDAMMAYIHHRNHRPPKENHGKTSVKKLMGMDQGANTMEINDANIKTFNRVAAKYNIDYAVQKDKSVNPPKYIIYFKGRDADVIGKAFKDYCGVLEHKKAKMSLRDRLHDLKDKKRENRDSPERERTKEKHKDREESR